MLFCFSGRLGEAVVSERPGVWAPAPWISTLETEQQVGRCLSSSWSVHPPKDASSFDSNQLQHYQRASASHITFLCLPASKPKKLLMIQTQRRFHSRQTHNYAFFFQFRFYTFSLPLKDCFPCHIPYFSTTLMPPKCAQVSVHYSKSLWFCTFTSSSYVAWIICVPQIFVTVPFLVLLVQIRYFSTCKKKKGKK